MLFFRHHRPIKHNWKNFSYLSPSMNKSIIWIPAGVDLCGSFTLMRLLSSWRSCNNNEGDRSDCFLDFLLNLCTVQLPLSNFAFGGKEGPHDCCWLLLLYKTWASSTDFWIMFWWSSKNWAKSEAQFAYGCRIVVRGVVWLGKPH